MTSSDETNEYSVFETGAEIMAYVYARHGADDLRKLLLMTLDNTTREALEDDATELEQVGLAKAAAIVREAAQKALPETDMSLCPYMQPPTQTQSTTSTTSTPGWGRSKRSDNASEQNS